MSYGSIKNVEFDKSDAVKVNVLDPKALINNNVENVDLSGTKLSNLHSVMDDMYTDVNIEKINIIDYAKTFLGTDYNYGSNDLSDGVDCSLFTQIVYRNYGVDLPRSSKEQRNYGTEVSSLSEAKPGDLLCFDGHVGIYMGNDQMIHASSLSDEVKIQDNLSNYVKSRPLVSIRRLM